ncbi:MAG: DUF2156 domain-containing protein [Treponema sp.]|nr:DUF2156 domain-containing protein [Treponema sp.]
MSDVEWAEPTVDDAEKLYMAACNSDVLSCTDSYTNIILYRKKYKTSICYYKGNAFRKYGALRATDKDLVKTRTLYGFPLGTGDLKTAIDFLTKDSQKNGLPLVFPLLSDRQKLLLEKKMPNRFLFTERRDDSDYIYVTRLLSDLPGSKFHKKKNHISQFMRKHSGINFVPITRENSKDALLVADIWFRENNGAGDYNKESERKIIEDALSLMEDLNLKGGILYADGKAVAMTIGSAISEKVFDIHFEKSIPGYDRDGAYALINQQFAKTIVQYEYVNREEDLGIEGLRKAKLSYHPEILLAKWCAEPV